MVSVGTNWGGNYVYRAERLHEPDTLDELRRVVSASTSLGVLGSRHTFHGLPDARELISLARLPARVEIDREARTATVGAGLRYGDVAVALHRAGYALHNMASLPHVSIGGAIATATHGSGDANGNLATAVTAIELVTADGEVVTLSRGQDEFPGAVVHLGALGVVTRVTIEVQPAYEVRQTVYEHVDFDAVLDAFDAVMASATSVSLFTDFGPTVNQLWRKHRLDAAPARLPDVVAAARPATKQLHLIAALPGDACTVQLGQPGPWLERLPHFCRDGLPSAGAEIQSEYMVAREHASDAIRALRDVADTFAPHLLMAEIRSIAADKLWMSTAYQRETIALHFTWRLEPNEVARVLPVIEEAIAPYHPRPHWGKLYSVAPMALAARYPRLPAFRALADRLDPRGVFRNAMLDAILGAS